MKSPSFPLIVLLMAVVVGAAVWGLHAVRPEFRLTAMLGGNVIMALLSFVSYLLVTRQLNASNPHAFVRAVSSATLLKLFICAGSTLGYALATRSHKHVPTLFVLFGIYIVYTVVETSHLSALARRKNQ